MPVNPTFPGVYIEEIPSGVRTITGVATSITAFIGRALRGSVNEARTINSFGDFERIFGGLWVESTLGFAVRDFYLNGGSQAVIIRLYHPFFMSDTDREKARSAAQAVSDAINASTASKPSDVVQAGKDEATKISNDPKSSSLSIEAANFVAAAADTAANTVDPTLDDAKKIQVIKKAASDAVNQSVTTKARLTVDTLILEAASEGAWGNSLRARVDYDTRPLPSGKPDPNLFNLTIRDMSSGITEQFRNVTVIEGPGQVDKVLENESSLVRAVTPLPNARPKASDADLEQDANGSDEAKAAAAKQELKIDPFKSDKRSTKVADADQVSDGEDLTGADDFTPDGAEDQKKGLFALKQADLFNLLCIPPHSFAPTGYNVEPSVIAAAATFCEEHRAMLIVDSPSGWINKDIAKSKFLDSTDHIGTRSKNAALFFPRLRQPNALKNNQIENFASCGAVAGIFARTDTQRGVWKAPAGLDATLVGVPQLSVLLNDAENGELNPLGINCLRFFSAAGRVVWGSRTLQGNDILASEWKYIPVRRTALYIEESLYRGTQWVVFEPNDEPLWAQIRLNVGAFMQNLFRQGAFQGQSPRDAYFVKCDKETTTQNDINLGIVNIVVGFAPLKPAEFVIIKIQQIAGQIAV